MLNLTLEIPNESHKAEYERVMNKWEQLEQNIQPELMRRYSEKRNGNIPYDIWLSYCEDDRTTGSMLSTHTPCTLFFCVENGGEIVGAVVMNHADTKRGHLHAGIVPWHRGKGYGTEMLRLALGECKIRGFEKVHIAPYKDNAAAVKTVINNGVYLTEEFTENGRRVLKFEIIL